MCGASFVATRWRYSFALEYLFILSAQGHTKRGGLRNKSVSQQGGSYYSLAGRDIERDLIPAIQDQKLGLLCWSPLAGGQLSGKFDRNSTSDKTARRVTYNFPPVDETKIFDLIDALKAVGTRHGVSAAQVALAWLLGQPAVTSVIVYRSCLKSHDVCS